MTSEDNRGVVTDDVTGYRKLVTSEDIRSVVTPEDIKSVVTPEDIRNKVTYDVIGYPEYSNL